MSEEITLKGDQKTLDPRLDRVVEFDEKSREYPIRTVLREAGTETPRTRTWYCKLWNDQGAEGACVGFAWSHELTAEPVIITAGPDVALRIYKRAQFLDYWPGEAYSGTSVLAGAKAVQELTSGGKQIMPSYRWAFGIDDLILSVGNYGPAVLGVNWYSGMFNTNAYGFITVSGSLAGGHAILARGVTIVWKAGVLTRRMEDIDHNKSYFTLRNSWGRDWGRDGDCKISVAGMARLLSENGECCIPVLRKAA